MATLTIKNLPPELYERLKLRAEANRRSINSEVIACIEQAVVSRAFDAEAFIQRARSLRARSLREKAPPYLLTDDDFNQAKREGRA